MNSHNNLTFGHLLSERLFSMELDIFIVLFFLSVFFILVSHTEQVTQNIIYIRYIDYDLEYGGVYAAFASGRKKVPSDNSNIWAIIVSYDKDYISGVYIPVGTAVVCFPKTVFGSRMRTEDGSKLLTEKNGGNTVLIRWKGTYFFISRSYLGTGLRIIN